MVMNRGFFLRSKRTVWLVLLAMLMKLATPALAQLQDQNGSALLTQQMLICTAAGLKLIPLPDSSDTQSVDNKSDAPVESGIISSDHCLNCSLCNNLYATPALSLRDLPAPSGQPWFSRRHFFVVLKWDHWSPSQPRAPPVLNTPF